MPFALAVPVTGSALDTTCAQCLPSPLPGVSVPAWLGDAKDASADRRFALQEGARRLAGSKALDGCFRRRQFGKDCIQGVYYPERGSAGLKGIQTCGSRWACPVCAALLSELSRRELKAAIDAHEAIYGVGSAVMATFTVPHYERQTCALVLGSQQRKKKGQENPLYGGLKRALADFASGRAGQAFYAALGITGTVRNLEVTHGGNGWHCHSHAVWFLDHVPTEKQLKAHWLLARNRWLDCVKKSGLPVASLTALKKHGFSLRGDKQYIEDYLAKMGKDTDWHVEHELAKGNVKQGKHGGRTPMQLLADFTYEGDEAAGILWAEYAATYRGSKQLYWSKGLRGRLLGSEREYTDAELLGIGETGELPAWVRPPAHTTIQDFGDREWAKISADGVRGLCLALVRQTGQTGDRAAFDAWFAPYRVFDRTQKPVLPQIARVKARLLSISAEYTDADAPPLAEGETDAPAPKNIQQEFFGGAYQNPLVNDPQALAFWPGLTSEQADRYQSLHARYQQEDGEGLPFFESRLQHQAENALGMEPVRDFLTSLYLAGGGKGRKLGGWYNLPVYEPDAKEIKKGAKPGVWCEVSQQHLYQEGRSPSSTVQFEHPGRGAVLRLLCYALALAPGLDWSEEAAEKPPVQAVLELA